MLRTTAFLIGFVLSVVVSGNIAAAQSTTSCAQRTDAIAHLANKYQERTIAMGLASNGGVVEILVTESGTTWSIIVTMPSGLTCMVAAGEHWEAVEPLKPSAGL